MGANLKPSFIMKTPSFLNLINTFFSTRYLQFIVRILKKANKGITADKIIMFYQMENIKCNFNVYILTYITYSRSVDFVEMYIYTCLGRFL